MNPVTGTATVHTVTYAPHIPASMDSISVVALAMAFLVGAIIADWRNSRR